MQKGVRTSGAFSEEDKKVKKDSIKSLWIKEPLYLFFLLLKSQDKHFFSHPFLVTICFDIYDKGKTEIQYDLALLASYKKKLKKTRGI